MSYGNKSIASEKKLKIFGKHPILEAVESGKQLEKLFLQKGISGEFMQKLTPFIKEMNIPVQFVPVAKLNHLTNGNHQGVVAFLPLVEYNRTENIVPHLYENGKVPLLFILDRISDVRNFGAIARTAECAGAHGIIIPQKGSAQINAEAIKASSGALHKISICRETNLTKIIKQLKLNGIQIVAADLKTSKYIYEVDMTGPTAIILGAEGQGISNEVTTACGRVC